MSNQERRLTSRLADAIGRIALVNTPPEWFFEKFSLADKTRRSMEAPGTLNSQPLGRDDIGAEPALKDAGIFYNAIRNDALAAMHRPFLFVSWVAGLTLLCTISGCARAQPAMQSIGVLKVTHGIQSMAWHPDGKRLAVGYFGKDEVEVWDVAEKKPLFKVPSQRRPINMSGQEVAFSPDGKYLVVQDFKDTKNGEPKFPRTLDDPNELPARADKDRYLLARVWDMDQRKEIAQIFGPGSVMHGGVQDGMCWPANKPQRIAIHRGAYVALYDAVNGLPTAEIDLSHPFREHPEVHKGYWRMACHSTLPLVAMQGAQFFDNGPLFGFPARSGATPIVVADVETSKIVKVLYTPTPLNGVIWTADGSKLVSFGTPPIRVWDATRDFSVIGEIWEAKGNSGKFAQVPGFDGVMGIADAIYLWDATKLKSVWRTPSPGDTFRTAVHLPSKTVAIASGRFAYLFRFDTVALNADKQEK